VRALITGGGGQLASDLQELLGADARSFSHAELDIADSAALDRAFEEVAPDVVFNCAAFHNVDVCETEEDRSFEVNARAVKRLAQRCEQEQATLVHLSTNYVFDGTREEPYAEDDRPNPRSIYALSKLAGEYAALAYCSSALVVRSAGLYGRHGSASKGGNFVQRMIARAREQGQLKMVADQRLNPTYTADLATGLIEAVENQATGILHITNSGDCSWHEFTVEIMRLVGIDVPIEAVDTAPGGVDRPRNGVLARSRTDVPPLRSWQEALADYLQPS
jgi:dTDP-4-dehydrorhamnose reductase